MKLKKMAALGAAVAIVAAITAGCGNADSKTTSGSTAAGQAAGSTEAAKEEAAETAATGEEMTLWYYWENESHQKALNEMIDQYNTQQTGYKLTAKYVPFADFKKQLSIGASASELPDLVLLDSPDHASYATMGIFADLTGKFDVSSYYDGPVASCTLEEVLYGVPFGSNCLGLYYNKDMFEAAGITKAPETWDELKDTAQKLTSGNVGGFAFCSLQNEEGTFNFMPWVWSTGATSYEMNSEGGIKALTFIKDLVDSGAMSKECINWTQGDVMNQFISGNVAMMINGPWQIPTIRQEAPDLNWDVALIPKDKEFASDLGGENWAVIAGGNEAGALDFLNYATQPEQVSFMMNTMGYISADKEIAKTQFTADEDAVYRKFIEEMEYTKARGPLAEWPSVSDAISLAFNQVMTGAMEPEKAAADAQTAIDAIVK